MKKSTLAAFAAFFATSATGFVPRGLVSVRADVDVKASIEQLGHAFEAFKATHKQEIEALKKGDATSEVQAKLEKIEADLVRHQKEIEDAHVKAAAGMSGKPVVKDAEYSDAFAAHMKKGEVQAALNKGADDEGGYLTPTEWDRTITDKLVLVSPMRQIASVVQTSKNAYTKLFNVGGTASGWVGEADARAETATSEFAPLTITTGEIYANPAATQQILDDSEINLEQWLAGEVQTEFAKQEGTAFVSGNGTNKPFGILTYVTGAANAAKHPFGAITLVKSGNANLLTADGIIDLVYDLPSAFTGNARFIMNRKTMAAARKLKDGSGTYLWQPSYLAGQPSTLAGFAVTEVPDMPDVAAGAKPIMFGDFRQGYLIVDRVGVRVLRDPFTKKPYILFYSTKRVGGGVVNPECLRALNVAA